MLDHATARAIADAADKGLFQRHGYDAKHDAQRNLEGRTFYATDEALRFFHARIQSARPECEGLVLILIESVAADYRNRSRGFRFTAFDIFGETLNERKALSPETLHKKSHKAREEAAAWLETFDVLAHYREAFATRAARLERHAAKMRAAAAELPA